MNSSRLSQADRFNPISLSLFQTVKLAENCLNNQLNWCFSDFRNYFWRLNIYIVQCWFGLWLPCRELCWVFCAINRLLYTALIITHHLSHHISLRPTTEGQPVRAEISKLIKTIPADHTVLQTFCWISVCASSFAPSSRDTDIFPTYLLSVHSEYCSQKLWLSAQKISILYKSLFYCSDPFQRTKFIFDCKDIQ